MLVLGAKTGLEIRSSDLWKKLLKPALNSDVMIAELMLRE